MDIFNLIYSDTLKSYLFMVNATYCEPQNFLHKNTAVKVSGLQVIMWWFP